MAIVFCLLENLIKLIIQFKIFKNSFDILCIKCWLYYCHKHYISKRSTRCMHKKLPLDYDFNNKILMKFSRKTIEPSNSRPLCTDCPIISTSTSKCISCIKKKNTIWGRKMTRMCIHKYQVMRNEKKSERSECDSCDTHTHIIMRWIHIS